MRHLVLLLACLPVPLVIAEEPDPEPNPVPDAAIRKLDDAIRNEEKIGRDKVEARRKRLLARLERMHADLVKRGQKDKARELKDRILLAESIRSGQGLDTRLTAPKLLKKASGEGRYRELLHVLYMPGDRQTYTDYKDFGLWSGATYGGYNNLKSGYWVYVHPRWYIWKEIKP
jgi:hypothetical protein